MAATTTLLGLVTPTQGTLSGTWGDTVNYGISDYVDIAVAGTLTLTGDGAVTLANTTGSSSGSNITSTLAGAGTVTAQFSAVRVSGTTTTKVVTGPSYSKTYLVDNASSFAVTFKASGQTGVSISPSEKVYVYYNATDYVKVGGGGITYGAVKTANYTAVANDGVQTNTTSGAFTVTLPSTPATGTQVFVADSFGTWGTNNLTIGRNGSTIEGSATDLVCDISGVNVQCVYNGTTWDIYAQVGANDTAVVTLNGTQTLTNKTLTSPTITGTGAIAAATVTLSSTLSVTGVSTLTGGAVIQGLTVGRGAGAVATNTVVGASAFTTNTTGAGNAAFGGFALGLNSTGNDNTALGYGAGYYLTSSGNTAVGRSALSTASSGSGGSNTAVGFYALQANTTASQNTAVGYQSMYANTTGDGTALGYRALYTATNRTSNTAIGNQALYSCATDENTAVGALALRDTSTGTANVAMGVQAGVLNTTGASNTAIGYVALNVNTTGSNNTALGRSALAANTTASNNTAVGYQAAYTSSTGINSIAMGYQALYSNTTGSYNVAIGRQAVYTNTTASENTAVGQQALFFATGGFNTAIGTGSGSQITTGTKNSILGAYSGNQGSLDIRTASNYIVLSDGDGNPRARWDGSGRPFFPDLGSDAGTNTVKFNTGTGRLSYDTSSARYKDNIRDSVYGLSHVMQMRSTQFEYKEGGRSDVGLIAEELQPIVPELVGVNKEGQADSVSYDRMVSVLVKAIQELKAEFDTYKSTHP